MASSLSARAAAARLGISDRSLRRLIAAGQLPAVRDGQTFRIAAADLEAYAAAPAARAAPAAAPAAPPAADGAALLRALDLVDQLQRDKTELAGLVGALQQRLLFAEDRIRALEAPREPEAAPGFTGAVSDGGAAEPAQQSAERKRPWWRWW